MTDASSSEIPWRNPWRTLSASEARKSEQELRRELCRGHCLFGLRVKGLGCRKDTDDFLFRVDAGPRVAVVHLTYQKETRPEWPSTELFDSIDAWVALRMTPDAIEYW